MQFARRKKGLAQPCPECWYPSFHPQGNVVQMKISRERGRETHLLGEMSAQWRADSTQTNLESLYSCCEREKKQKTN